MLGLFKKRNYKQEVAHELWGKLKDSKFRSEVHEYVRHKVFNSYGEYVEVWQSLYSSMNPQETYLNVHKLCLECRMAEKERIAKKPFTHRLLFKLFPKVFLDTEIELLDSIYVAGEEVETFENLLLAIKTKSEQWKQYS